MPFTPESADPRPEGPSAPHNRLDRRLAIAREAQAQILELYAGGIETRSLAERFGVQENYIRKLASRNGVRKGRCAFSPPPQPKAATTRIRNGHIAAYKLARRGFSVPSHLEPEYTQLLISGHSRREAAEQLGLLSPNSEGNALIMLGCRPRRCPT